MSEWIWRGVILCVLTGQLWVSTRFVGVADFQLMVKTLSDVRDRVLVIEQAVKSTERMDRDVTEIEGRVRSLENASSSREMRVRDLERESHGVKPK